MSVKDPLIYNLFILLVEDDLVSAKILEIHLQKAGYTNIKIAKNGKEAIESILTETPDLIVLDLLMPLMDGFSVLKWVREKDLYKDIPIIVQTSLEDIEGTQRAWNLGATDLIRKPIERFEFLSRVSLHLNQYILLQELTDYKNRASEDIENALALQLSLLPDTKTIDDIKEKYNVFLDYIFKPCRFLSGDLFSIFPLDDESFAIWISDFSGKGIKASLNTFRIHTIINDIEIYKKKPSDVLQIINKKLVNLLPIGSFATCLFGVVNTKEKTFTYSSAGQPEPILYRKNHESVDFFESKGLPLGIQSHFKYEDHQILLKEGDHILLYSDALLETEDLIGFSFEEKKISDFLMQTDNQRIIDRVKLIFEELEAYDFSVSDDLTLIEFSLL